MSELKMIESDIEEKVIDVLKDLFHEHNYNDDIQIVGCWKPSDNNNIKGEEDSDLCVIGVKTLPRSYETPTIQYASITTIISMAVRSDVDFTGINYLEITSRISNVLQRWQNNFQEAENSFKTIDGFEFTGFELNGGDCGMDKENCVWQFQQSFTIYGIITEL